jgi:hypothetical protein
VSLGVFTLSVVSMLMGFAAGFTLGRDARR